MVLLAGLDWGNVPAWFGAAVTGGSAFLAALAYRRSVRDRELEQASKVVAWIFLTDQGPELRVVNASDAPIFDVSVPLGRWPQSKEWLDTGSVPGRDYASRSVDVRNAVPGTDLSYRIKETHRPRMWHVVFRDSLGRKWARQTNGKLVSMSPTPPSTENLIVELRSGRR